MRRRRLARRGNVSSTGSTTVSDEIADSIISNATAKLIADRKLYKRDLGIISGLKELVNGAIVNLMGKVERSQKKELNKINRDYVSGRLSSPTHAQLTKDFNFHPLHEIAATLAINAVTMVADLMVEAWHGHTPPSQIVRVMTAFIRHPRLMRLAANVDATNQKIWEITGLVVEQWAQHHPERITRLSVEKALSGNVDFTSSDLSLAHMHEHGHHHADQIEALSDSFHS